MARGARLAMVTFICVALMGVGFASWLIAQPGGISAGAGGDIFADGVTSNGDCVCIVGTPVAFEFSPNGFVQDGKLCGHGDVVATVRADAQKCRELLGAEGGVEIFLTLRFSDGADGALFTCGAIQPLCDDECITLNTAKSGGKANGFTAAFVFLPQEEQTKTFDVIFRFSFDGTDQIYKEYILKNFCTDRQYGGALQKKFAIDVAASAA